MPTNIKIKHKELSHIHATLHIHQLATTNQTNIYYSDINDFKKDSQNENSSFALLCSENYVLTTNKCIRHLYDEIKHILYRD